MSNKEFIWNDELVLEFVQFSLKQSSAFQGRQADLEQFKESKQPKPLFKTEDGMDIFEGDEYWYVTKDFKIYLDQCDSMTGGKTVAHGRLGDKFFSTEEVAKNWLLYNTPLITLNEIKDIGQIHHENVYFVKLKQLARKKLEK